MHEDERLCEGQKVRVRCEASVRCAAPPCAEVGRQEVLAVCQWSQ